MDTRDMVLLVVSEAGEEGRLEGHTLLQKICYFVSRLSNEKHGFKAHFYGPYSSRVKDAKDSLVGLRFLRETQEILPWFSDDQFFEPRRYTFAVTDGGKNVLERLRERLPEECSNVKENVERIKKALGSLDYQVLSIAAKVNHILSANSPHVTYEHIQEKAGQLGWNLTSDQINGAADLLCTLELATKG